MKTDILIVGGGPAGILAALTANSFSPKTKILLVKNEKGMIVRCSEPYVLGQKVKLSRTIHSDNEIFKKNRIGVLNDEVINFSKKNIAFTREGKEIQFKKLILATGAEPFIPPIPGIKKGRNIFTIRRASDLRKIERNLKKCHRVVIIGGGAIGVEVASLLKQRGLKVSILEVAQHLVSGAYDEDYSQKVEAILRSKGVKIKLGVKIKEIRERDILLPKEKIDYDLIICSCGVRANTELAQKLGCRLGKFGLEINQFGQTSVRGVWAAGDCAQAKSLITGKIIPSQLATTAVIMGKVAGANAVGKKMKFEGVLNPAVSCFFDMGVGRVGMTQRQAIREGYKTVVSSAQSIDKYPSQKTAKPIELKLIFDRKNKQLLGAQLFGGKDSLGMRVDLLSLAIAHRFTAQDLAHLNYCAHPETTTLPFMEPIVMASEKILPKN